ncbi:hypothetical protein B296_00039229 [Ensete ventricosum]|uniref:Uncharacterized protein n=1 Tax=Ensete ventricosum TaxID=4639 RepID=A0A426YQ87_ENSVE|nr:hypothetical protein B296_00039229 [Ensete ventricosum]
MTTEVKPEVDLRLLSALLDEEEEEEKEEVDKGLPANDEAAMLDVAEGGENGDQRYFLTSIQDTVVIRQIRSQGLSFQLWPAASSLVSLLDSRPSALLLPATSRILELGSGTGLVGIAAAAILGVSVTLTDLPHVLPNLRFNAESNAAAVAARGGSLDVRQLRWGEDEDAAALVDGEAAFDVVVASDVVYYEHLIDPLLRTLRVFVKGEAAFVMAHLRRWKKRDSVFFRKARKLFDVALVHTDSPLPGKRVGVAIYRFTAKRAPKK